MGRRIRHVPPGGALVEVTCRTIQGRLLLRPAPALDEILIGTIGRAQRRYGVVIHALYFLSNHYHLLISVQNARQLARFMGFINSKIAREAGRIYEWKEKFWGDRYHAIPISDEPEAQIGRLCYVLSQGVKEGLVARPQDWPGVHCVEALLEGKSLKGLWYDRTAEGRARRKGLDYQTKDFAEEEEIVFTPLPCWAHLPAEEYRQRIAELIRSIEQEAEAERRATGQQPLGPEQIYRQHPHQTPTRSKKSPAPLVHAASRAVRRRFQEAYRLFLNAYRAASEKLRAGDRDAVFPEGCFPPALPFVPDLAPG